MHRHQEVPDTRLERYLIILLLIGMLLVGDRLVARILSDLDRPHTVEFLALAFLAVLALYLLILFLHLLTARYTLTEGQLICRHGWTRVALDLHGGLHLHRWRSRWAWSGGASRDLGVEELNIIPALGLLRQGSLWVVVGEEPGGVYRAVALRPSPRLLALLKGLAAERLGAGD
ncbi:MAG: hypothetical protein ACOY93_05350 [Bacillota bacterium]